MSWPSPATTRNLNFRLMPRIPGDGIATRMALTAANAITPKDY